MDISKIEYHLEFYNEDGEQVEHYGNMPREFVLPRQGERVCLVSKKRTFEVTRVVHDFAEYGEDRIGYVARVHGKEVPFEPRE